MQKQEFLPAGGGSHRAFLIHPGKTDEFEQDGSSGHSCRVWEQQDPDSELGSSTDLPDLKVSLGSTFCLAEGVEILSFHEYADFGVSKELLG